MVRRRGRFRRRIGAETARRRRTLAPTPQLRAAFGIEPGEELGLPYEYVHLDAKKNEHRTPRYLAIHPRGKVPALVDGDQKFFESGAILLYLGNRYGVAKRMWPAQTDQHSADALCWTVWSMAELSPYMMQYLYHGLDTPFSYRPEQRSAACAEFNQSQLIGCLDALETRLDGRDYLLGAFSLVDVAVASRLLIGTTFGVSLGGHPNVATWVRRCGERPALKRAR
jgi:glutathione S-transferase